MMDDKRPRALIYLLLPLGIAPPQCFLGKGKVTQAVRRLRACDSYECGKHTAIQPNRS